MVPLGGVGGGLCEPRGGGKGGGLSEPGEYWRPGSADWRPPLLSEEVVVMAAWMERGGRAGAPPLLLPGLSHLKRVCLRRESSNVFFLLILYEVKLSQQILLWSVRSFVLSIVPLSYYALLYKMTM